MPVAILVNFCGKNGDDFLSKKIISRQDLIGECGIAPKPNSEFELSRMLKEAKALNLEHKLGIPESSIVKDIPDLKSLSLQFGDIVQLAMYLPGDKKYNAGFRTYRMLSMLAAESIGLADWQEEHLTNGNCFVQLAKGLNHEPGMRWVILSLISHLTMPLDSYWTPGMVEKAASAEMLSALLLNPKSISEYVKKGVVPLVSGYQIHKKGCATPSDCPCLYWDKEAGGLRHTTFHNLKKIRVWSSPKVTAI